MKNILIAGLFIMIANLLQAQPSAAAQLSNKIAQKMKDSLSLTETQKVQLYNINLQLHEQKMNLRRQITSTDSLTLYTQKVENTRDSLYHTVLAEDKYLLYKQKKRNLVSNN